MKLKGLNSGKAKEITKCLKNWIKAFFRRSNKRSEKPLEKLEKVRNMKAL